MSSLHFFGLAILAIAFQPLYAQQEASSQKANAGSAAATPRAKIVDPEAQAAVRKGVELLEAKQFKEAINAFLAAARRYPQNGQMRHLLGFAYAQDKQLGPAWLQFRQAVRFNPAYEVGVRDFLSMWSAFDKKGVLNTGRAREEIAKLLGQPDNKKSIGDQEVWEYGFMRLQFAQGRLAAVVDPRGMDSETSKALDIMEIEFDDQTRWRIGYRAINRLQSVTEFVTKDESVQQWKELYTVQRLYNLKTKTTPQKMMNQIEANLRKANPNIDFIKLLDGENDVLFHWRNKGTKDRQAQHEIVRLVAGQKDIHRLAYARRVAQIPTAEAQIWLDLLRNAELTQPTAPVVDASSRN